MGSVTILAAGAMVSAPSVQANRASPFRIAVYTGKNSQFHNQYLRSIVETLVEIEWITIASEMITSEIVGRRIDIDILWDILAFESGPLLRFPKDALYRSHCNDGSARNELLMRLEQRNDIDLVLAFGDDVEWLINDPVRSIPVLVIGLEEHRAGALLANPSPHESANGETTGATSVRDPRTFVHMSSEKAERNIKLFHDLVNFSRLGVIHGRVAEPKRRLEDDRLRPISESIGIDITHCFLSNDLDCGLDNSEFIKCCESLATKVDALYIKSQPGFNASTLPTLLDICNSHNVATFSPVSEAHVKSGLLMSTIGRGAYKRAGWGVTQQIVKILSDRPVELLSRDAGDDIDIAINIHTANQIGVYLPAHVIAAADEIYDQAHPDYFFDE